MSDRCREHKARCCQTCENYPPAPTSFPNYYGTCPRCKQHKFIGHGPLCPDCFATPAQPFHATTSTNTTTPADAGSTPDDREVLAERESERSYLSLEWERLAKSASVRAKAAEAERDDLRARLAAVEALAEKWIGMGIMRSMTGTISAERGRELRDALGGAS